MDKSDLITLEALTYKKDALGQLIPSGKVEREIFCCIKSVTRAEWADAAQLGLKATYCVTVWADEYNGETIAIFDGKRYAIYRTYQPNSEDIELYLEQRAGV